MSYYSFIQKNNLIYLNLNNEIKILIDKEDKEKIISFPFKWKLIKNENEIGSIATSKGKYYTILLKNFITKTDQNTKINYKNGDSLDLRKENLSIEVENNYTFRNSTIKDIEFISTLYSNKQTFFGSYSKELINKNKTQYQIIENESKTQGFYRIIPLKKGVYHSLLNNEVPEQELNPYIQTYQKQKNLYLYLQLLLKKDFEQSLHKTIFKEISLHTNKIINNFVIKEVGFINLEKINENIISENDFFFYHHIGTINHEGIQKYKVYRKKY